MNILIYRVHYSCPAKHEIYFDYKTLRTAMKYLQLDNDTSTWFAYKISIFKKSGV